MNEFIGECRKEWQRLGVPDPVANEMAADLTADIDEAEAEGGSAEDVLGNSLFDPQHFAASWAEARGVTSTPSTPSTPSTAPRRSLSRRQIAAAALAALAVVLVMGALVLGIGHQSASVAMSVRKILGPGSVHWFGAGPATPPARVFVSGPYSRWATAQARPSSRWACCSRALWSSVSLSSIGLLGLDATPSDSSDERTRQQSGRSGFMTKMRRGSGSTVRMRRATR